MRVHPAARTTADGKAEPVPLVVVVGAASRDIAADDPRGWRLGGAVTYASLTLARLGLRVNAIVGADADAATSAELAALADAGVTVEPMPIASGPVFENIETAGGRRQRCVAPVSAMAPSTVAGIPPEVAAILFAPVAGELAETAEAWLAVAPPGALVALGLQGFLRELRAGADVRRLPPTPSSMLRRADLVGLSRDDLPAGHGPAAVVRLASPSAAILVTEADRGGLSIEHTVTGRRVARRYRAVESRAVVDPTGAGDVFLAAVLATRLVGGLATGGGGGRAARELRFAAAAASLAVEAPGIGGVPGLAAVRRRLARARSLAERRASAASRRGSGRPSHT